MRIKVSKPNNLQQISEAIENLSKDFQKIQDKVNTIAQKIGTSFAEQYKENYKKKDCLQKPVHPPVQPVPSYLPKNPKENYVQEKIPLKNHLLKREEIEQLKEEVFSHPINPKAKRLVKHISDALGMRNIGIHLVRLQTSEESTEFHYHLEEEEFVYILSGKGIANIGHEMFEIKAGDFLGFTAPSLPHKLKNPFQEELVYLMGGERRPYDIIEYPEAHKRGIRVKNEIIFIECRE